MTQGIGNAANVRGFVFTTPQGETRLAAHVDFDDATARVHRGDFDGRESISIAVPSPVGAWTSFPAQYTSTDLQRVDRHVALADLGSAGVDVASLLRYGLLATAVIDGPVRGGELVNVSSRNVHDVGAVDANGIGWVGNLMSNRISKYHHDRQPLPNGGSVKYSASNFGTPGNLRFELEVFAPATTPQVGLTRDEKRAALVDMGLRVETNFGAGGNRGFRYLDNAGPDKNNFRVSWELADPSLFANGTPPTGIYPVRILAGDRVVAHFDLDWVNPAR